MGLAPLLLALFAAADFGSRFEEIKKTATKEQLYAFLYELPKGGDLHHHLALSIQAELWYAAATDPKRSGGNEYFTRVRFSGCPDSAEPFIRFHTIQRSTYRKLSECQRGEYEALKSLPADSRALWISSLKLDRPGEARNEFFEMIVPRMGDLIRDPVLFKEVAGETLRRSAGEGLRYVETQVSAPRFMDQEGNWYDPEQGVAEIRQLLKGINVPAVRFLYPVLRFTPQAEQTVERAYEFVAGHRDLWTGVNLVGREDNDKGHALRFLDTFRKMRTRYSGVHLSIHAGEVDSPGQQVRDTLLLGAERIGHGTNLITDPDTIVLMRNNRYLVEVSLVSNRLLEYTPDLTKHPFPEYLRLGIPVCLNTDDAGPWDSNLTDEYYTAVTTYNLSWKEVVELGRNSLVHSFAEPPLKKSLLADYDAAVSRFEVRYMTASPYGKAVASGYAGRTFGIRF